MNHLVPIQITLQAANAADARQLVQDLAGTMSGMPNNDIPDTTEVSTLPAAPTNPPQAQPPYQAPTVPVSSPGGFPGQPAPQQPAPQAPTQPDQAFTPPPTGQVPTSAPTYDINQLGVAAGPLVDAGRGPELTAWLQQHGAQALTALNPSLYGEFATYLRSLGAKI